MKKVELICDYMVGTNGASNILQNKTVITFNDKDSLIETSRTFLTENFEKKIITGTCLLIDFLDNLDGSKIFKIENFMEKIEKLQGEYSKDFVSSNKTSGGSLMLTMIVDNEKYIYSNLQEDSFEYLSAVEFITFNPLLKLNNKMLQSILETNLFN